MADGSFNAQAVLDGKSYAFKGTFESGSADGDDRRAAVELQVSVDAGGNLSGSVDDTELFGRRVTVST